MGRSSPDKSVQIQPKYSGRYQQFLVGILLPPEAHFLLLYKGSPAPPSCLSRVISELTVQVLVWSRSSPVLSFPLYQGAEKLSHQLPHLGHARQQALKRVGVARRLTGHPQVLSVPLRPDILARQLHGNRYASRRAVGKYHPEAEGSPRRAQAGEGRGVTSVCRDSLLPFPSLSFFGIGS